VEELHHWFHQSGTKKGRLGADGYGSRHIVIIIIRRTTIFFLASSNNTSNIFFLVP
jgi:hypothetical protein